MEWTTNLYTYRQTMKNQKTKYISPDCYLYDKWNNEYSFYWFHKLKEFIQTQNYCYQDRIFFSFLIFQPKYYVGTRSIPTIRTVELRIVK